MIHTTPRRLRSALMSTCLTLAAAAAWAAASVAGTWNMSVESPAGSGNPSFVLKQEGEKITGTYNGAFGSAPVTGALKGDVLTLSYSISGGPVVTYTGKVTGNKVEGTTDMGSIGKGSFKGSRN
jgi:hypothetical protein